MRRHQLGQFPGGRQREIKSCKSIRVRPLLDESTFAAIRITASVPTSFSHSSQIEFLFEGSRLLIGSSGDPNFSSKAPSVEFDPDYIGPVIEDALGSLKSPKDQKQLRLLKRKLHVSATGEFPMPDALILFDSLLVSRVDALIDFDLRSGVYTVSKLGSHAPGFVTDDACKWFIFGGDDCFVKVDVYVGNRCFGVERQSPRMQQGMRLKQQLRLKQPLSFQNPKLGIIFHDDPES